MSAYHLNALWLRLLSLIIVFGVWLPVLGYLLGRLVHAAQKLLSCTRHGVASHGRS